MEYGARYAGRGTTARSASMKIVAAGGRLARFRRHGGGPRPASVEGQGLAQVVDQVVAVLDADGQPDQVPRDRKR